MTRTRLRVALLVVLAALAGIGVWLAGRGDDGAAAPAPTSSAATPTASASPSPSAPASPAASPSASTTPGASSSGPPADDGLPQVTIETPTPGEHARIPVHASGTVVAFEAVARYEVLQGGSVFTDGPLYADKGAPERGRWETDIELPLGRYTLVVFVESPKDGHRIAEARVAFEAG